MYNIYKEDDFPSGAFSSEVRRKLLFANAFYSVLKLHNGVELTTDLAKSECKIIENTDELSYDRLPCLAVYPQWVPMIRLYLRGGKFFTGPYYG